MTPPDTQLCKAIRDQFPQHFAAKMAIARPAALPERTEKPLVRCRWSPFNRLYFVWRDSSLLGGPPAFGGLLEEYGQGETIAEAYANFCGQQEARIWPYQPTS